MACGLHEEDIDLATERLPSHRSSSGLPSSSQSVCTGNSCGTCSSERGQALPRLRPKCLKCKDQLAVVRISRAPLAVLNGAGRAGKTDLTCADSRSPEGATLQSLCMGLCVSEGQGGPQAQNWDQGQRHCHSVLLWR